jgi:protein gp37
MAKSKIAWTEYSWNPTTGCSKVSPGCDNCYAESVLVQREMDKCLLGLSY